MDLSIIIVNYNVKYFLEKCLLSVQKAIGNLATEIFVIDNASSDNSLSYLTERFPGVTFIENKINVGFAKANNQALALSKGRYILFLNPDTILPEDGLSACIHFMELHADAGACGVRMIDGAGHYLPESKRGFPTLIAAFYKLMGITAKFPRSVTFARYYMGHLPETEVNEVDVLAGAFFMARKSVLDITGGFDEAFFMYGEDIDLSYRIQQAGYKNYYFPRVTIIHFKGESTKKGNLDYVRVFYKAMSIFVNKHHKGKGSGWFSFLVQSAIMLRSIPPAVRVIFKPREKKVLPSNLQTLIIGSKESAARIQEILENKTNTQRAYTVLPVLGPEIPVHVQEVIYCEKDIPYKFIIHMLDALPLKIAFRFFDEKTNVIIGSDSKNKSGIVIV